MSIDFLRECFNKYKCDKGFKHGYEVVYATAFEQAMARFGRVDLLEIGVYKGQSCRAFAEYFETLEIPYQIYAMDIFVRVPISKVIESCSGIEHIEFIQDDSQNPAHKGIFAHDTSDINPINIIIDDAEHTPRANHHTLRNYWDFLPSKGIYVIEDVWPLDTMSRVELQHWWLRKYQEDYTLAKYEEFIDACHKRDPLYEEIDLREPHPDSFIIKLEKDRDSIHHLSPEESDLLSGRTRPDLVH